MPENRRVLLTGGSGFVGRHAQQSLLNRGFEVHAVYLKSGSEWLQPGVVSHRCDLQSPTDLNALVESVRPTHLLHCAWYAEHEKYWESLENIRWVAASLDLICAFAENGGTRAVCVGTCAEYEWTENVYKEGAAAIRPRSLYGVCKNALWSVLEKAATHLGIQIAWGRIFFVYGPHEVESRLIPTVIRSLLADEPAELTHGRQVRDFMYVEDAADALAAFLDSGVTGAVDIASGNSYPLSQVAQLVGSELKRSHLIRLGARQAPPGEVEVLESDAVRLRREVGFTPSYGLDDGLRRTIDWWRKYSK